MGAAGLGFVRSSPTLPRTDVYSHTACDIEREMWLTYYNSTHNIWWSLLQIYV